MLTNGHEIAQKLKFSISPLMPRVHWYDRVKVSIRPFFNCCGSPQIWVVTVRTARSRTTYEPYVFNSDGILPRETVGRMTRSGGSLFWVLRSVRHPTTTGWRLRNESAMIAAKALLSNRNGRMNELTTPSTEHLTTEQQNENWADLDKMDSLSIVTLMNQEDATVTAAVTKALPVIGKAVDAIVKSLQNGGRLIYVGAGTSGRLGVLDASECPPTFSTDPNQIVALLAGGHEAMFRAVEGAEDDETAGRTDLLDVHLKKEDIVVGISASGRTPYVVGALACAQGVGARTVSLSCNMGARASAYAEIAIEVETGPEVLSGSTRLKAATAQKMVLNMLSTAAMVKMGKVYTNLMVDMNASNSKLTERACRIVMKAAGVDRETAREALERTGYESKVALVMLKTGLLPEEARERLREASGFVRSVIEGQSFE